MGNSVYNIIIRIACARGETGTVQQSIVSYRPLIVRVHASPIFSFALCVELILPCMLYTCICSVCMMYTYFVVCMDGRLYLSFFLSKQVFRGGQRIQQVAITRYTHIMYKKK